MNTKTIITICLMLLGTIAVQAQDNGNSDYTKGFLAYFKKDYATAITLYQRAIGKGSAKAMIAMGDLYKKGEGVTKNEGEAKKWYEKGRSQYTVLAQSGDSKAIEELADLYYMGTKIEKNYAEALKYYIPMAQEGKIMSMRRIGYIYETGGFGASKDLKKAAEWYLKVHDYGEDMSQSLQRIGVAVPKKLSTEDEYARMMAKADNEPDPSEYRALGMKLYAKRLKEESVADLTIKHKVKEKLLQMADIDFYGTYNSMLKLTDIDVKELLTIFSQPQQQVIRELANYTQKKTGYPASAPAPGKPWSARSSVTTASTSNNTATNRTAYTDNGNTELGKGVTEYNNRNYTQAYNLFKQSATKGNDRAMYNLGVAYEYARGPQKNIDQARYWYLKAEEKGNTGATQALARIGRGTTTTRTQNTAQNKQTAPANNGVAEYNKGVEAYKAKNYDEALKLYKTAAEKGLPEAMNNLGNMYLQGEGVKRDYKEAFNWFKKAADKDFPIAMGVVGVMYYSGEGTEKNAPEAFKWMKKAVDKGNTNVLVMELLALAYEHGVGTTQNYTEAEKWFQKATEAGSETATASLKIVQENKKHVTTAKTVFAGSKVPKQLIPFKDDNRKYGFKDETGKIVVAPKYNNFQDVYFSGDGMAMVLFLGKWGYVNQAGKEVIPPKYDQTKDFIDGMAAVRIGEKWGMIDKTGKTIVPPKYDEIENYRDGMAAINIGGTTKSLYGGYTTKEGGWGFVNKTGKEIIPLQYDRVGAFFDGLSSVEIDKKKFYIDKTGKEVIPAKYSFAFSFKDGLAKVRHNNLLGFINIKGEEVIPPAFDDVGDFSDGMASFRHPYHQQRNHKKGYIDKIGKEIVSPKYDKAEDFSEGMAAVGIGETKMLNFRGKWGFIDKTGKEVVPLRYDKVGKFSEGLAAVSLSDKWGFIDKRGGVVIPLEYEAKFFMFDYISPVFRNGVAEVIKDDKIILIDKTGRIVTTVGTVPKSSNN